MCGGIKREAAAVSTTPRLVSPAICSTARPSRAPTRVGQMARSDHVEEFRQLHNSSSIACYSTRPVTQELDDTRRGRVAGMATGSGDALEERVARLRELLASDPDDALSWFSLGRALLELGPARGGAGAAAPRARARPRLHRGAARPRPRAARVGRGGRGRARARGGLPRSPRPRGDLQTAREMRVFLRRARSAQGLATRSRGGAARAARAGRERGRRARREAHALYRRGFDHFANGRCDEAIALFREAIALEPGLAIAWNGSRSPSARRTSSTPRSRPAAA